MTRYGEIAQSRSTPQAEKAHPAQERNNAGGFSFVVDCWKRLDRFLILGSEGGTYYVGERKLTLQNVACLRECIEKDGARTVKRIVEISDSGRAPKNDPAIFALAVCAAAKDPATRAAALGALPAVCRIGTHLFHFVSDVTGQRRWSRALRRAVAKWYTDRPADKLALQLAKYQQRDGTSHKDVLRRAHPVAPTPQHNAALRWATHGIEGTKGILDLKKRGVNYPATPELPALLQAFEEIHSGVDVKTACELVVRHKLPHECVPNELKGKPEIWEALLPSMGQTALIRNLAKMTSVGLIKPMASSVTRVCEMITDKQALYAGRVHPLAILMAQSTYRTGHGLKGSLSWTPVSQVVDALDDAFYLAFEAIEPTGKRRLLALDVSGSMGGPPIAGSSVSPREGAAIMAMVTARVEKNYHIMAFGHRFEPFDVSPKMRLDAVVDRMSRMDMQRTDCSLPMRYASHENIQCDSFEVYTDSETWFGPVHPHQALAEYRARSVPSAKMLVCAMTATQFTIAPPDDAGCLDVVGMDAATPAIMADFVADREVTA